MINVNKKVTRIMILAAVSIVALTACQSLMQPPSQAVLNPSVTPDAGEGFYSGLLSTPTPRNTPVLNLPPIELSATPNAIVTMSETIKADVLPEPTKQELCLVVEPSLPKLMISNLRALGITNCKTGEEAEGRIGFEKQNPVSYWVYVLVAPFNTVKDDLNSEKLIGYWTHGTSAPFSELIVDQATENAILSLWGKPKGKVSVHPSDQMLDLTWKNENTWAIIPFEALQPRWKVIALDGKNPLSKHFESVDYLLNVPISIWSENSKQLSSYTNSLIKSLPVTNRDPKKLANIVMTGVTALARATAYDMEINGITKPAQEVGDILKDADVLHISNEAPFIENCPYPDPYQRGDLLFCSAENYLELLKVIGTDVVDLTGDHLLDYGQEALLHTLAAYRMEGWKYFGAGLNLKEAQKAVTFEINGNQIAFIGCNAKPLSYLAATDASAGVFHCEMDKLTSSIKQLKSEGFNPIVTFQHDEVYNWYPTPRMVDDFSAAAEAGAVIVSGSQGHQPQAMTFLGADRFIHYGLGNLFFDQFGLVADTDKAFIDRHIFYENRYISTELLTVKFTDFSTPRWMNESERIAILNRLFANSDY